MVSKFTVPSFLNPKIKKPEAAQQMKSTIAVKQNCYFSFSKVRLTARGNINRKG